MAGPSDPHDLRYGPGDADQKNERSAFRQATDAAKVSEQAAQIPRFSGGDSGGEKIGLGRERRFTTRIVLLEMAQELRSKAIRLEALADVLPSSLEDLSPMAAQALQELLIKGRFTF